MTSEDAARLLGELRFALAEGDALPVPAQLRAKVIARSLRERAAGTPSVRPPHISGERSLVLAVRQMDALLGELTPEEWRRPALRDLDVQGLVGHLLAVEDGFADSLEGVSDAAADVDHVASTQPVAEAQAGRAPGETLEDWRGATQRTVAALRAATGPSPSFYGIRLPLDDLLVVRAFEVWIHHEDIRRATHRPLAAPDDASLARMTSLGVMLLPVGIAIAGRERRNGAVHLVITGPGGGTWDVPFDGSPAVAPTPRRRTREASVVVDGAAFCRVVGNRADLATSGARVAGTTAAAADLFTAAAALALD
jgi:uncharacterized protein (TIGR03083 family)